MSKENTIMRGTYLFLLAVLAGMMSAAPAQAQIVVPGADGSDGVFAPTTSVQIDLSQAPTGTWNGVNTSPGNGVYDPDKWAVVFRYSSVNIPPGAAVTFANHPSRAPVVWLVGGDPAVDPDAGNVMFEHWMLLDNSLTNIGLSEPGPGGFRGGHADLGPGAPRSGGFGPGGGPANSGFGNHGSYTTGVSVYGNERIIPLIGGSGGSGRFGASARTGHSGGGAILIAATGTITLEGTGGIFARGVNFDSGYPRGSGGAIRLIADSVTGTAGQLRAQGDAGGGQGRIRIEANSVTLADQGNPVASVALPDTPALIWPPAGTPSVQVVSVGTQAVPADPQASMNFPNSDVSMASVDPVTVTIETQNVPIPPDPLVWAVIVRVVPRTGLDFTVAATHVSGTEALSTWTADVTLPNGFCAIQVRASAP